MSSKNELKRGYLYRRNPLLEMISAWQSLTVSPLRLSSSPLTHRFPDGKKRKKNTCTHVHTHTHTHTFTQTDQTHTVTHKRRPMSRVNPQALLIQEVTQLCSRPSLHRRICVPAAGRQTHPTPMCFLTTTFFPRSPSPPHCAIKNGAAVLYQCPG